ncbi:MAG: response regulator [Gammaproteobacteria bacterium]
MDLEMPVMDGFEATRRIKQEMDVKILAISARVYDADVKKAYDAGIDGFIGKPYRLSTILNEINSVAQTDEKHLHGGSGEVITNAEVWLDRSLTEDQKHELQQAILRADPTSFRSILDSCADLDSQNRKLLLDMVESYQYEKVINLLKQESRAT